jgi:transcriptional regulator with XRE-family HTH domain
VNSWRLWAKLQDKEYRDAFVSSNINTGLAFQIRDLREQKDWSQKELGRRIGRKPGQEQPGVSRMESPGHRFNLETLKKLASAFDVALVVRFVPFSELAAWVQNLGPDSLRVRSFAEEMALSAPAAPLSAASMPASAALPEQGHTTAGTSASGAASVASTSEVKVVPNRSLPPAKVVNIATWSAATSLPAGTNENARRIS